MYKIQTLNKISSAGLAQLGPNYKISDDEAAPDGIILRSFKMHDMELPKSLLSVARAGAGVNNIPIEKCTDAGVVVFNTPGANANAVKELIICGLMLAARKVWQGINWAQSLKGQEDVAGLRARLAQRRAGLLDGAAARGGPLVGAGGGGHRGDPDAAQVHVEFLGRHLSQGGPHALAVLDLAREDRDHAGFGEVEPGGQHGVGGEGGRQRGSAGRRGRWPRMGNRGSRRHG